MDSLEITRPLAKTIDFAENFDAVQTLDDLKYLVDMLYGSDKVIGFDIETGYRGADRPGLALNAYHPDQFIAGFSLTNDPSWARYVPVRHDHAENIDPNEAWEVMKPLLEEKTIVSHNLLFEATNLRMLDVKGDGPEIRMPVATSHDSMIQAFVLSDVPPMPVSGALEGGELVQRYIPEFHQTEDGWQREDRKSFGVGLKSLTKFRYNYDQAEIHTLFDTDKPLTSTQRSRIRFNSIPVSPATVHYACDDAYLCLQLHLDQLERINEDPYLPKVYSLEMQVLDILVDMHVKGVGVDWDSLSHNHSIYQSFIHEMKIRTVQEFEKEVGHRLPEINLRSTKQLRELLYSPVEEGGLGYETTEVTDSGQMSTSEDALKHLKNTSPGVKALLEYRACEKTGGWFDNWNNLRGQHYDDRIHPNFSQVVVKSGRFSSSGPNVQQISKRWWSQTMNGSVPEVMTKGTFGKDYWTGSQRDFIVAEEGYYILSFDYQSAEVQMVAALSGEKEMIDAFNRGEDFHRWTAALVNNKDQSEVTPKERQAAKSNTFGNIYKQSVPALAQQLGITKEEAQDVHDKFFARFPKLQEWFTKQETNVHITHELRTWMGRRATVWESMHANRGVRNKADRLSRNIPVQGGATGDYPKMAMVRAANWLKSRGWWGEEVRLIMNQHDSLVFEVKKTLDITEVVEGLTAAVQFSLAKVGGLYEYFETFPPMSVDWEIGEKWGSIMDLKDKDVMDSTKLVVEIEDAVANDIQHLMYVANMNPGPIPVKLFINGEEVSCSLTVKAHPIVASQMVKGAPDLGHVYNTGGRVAARFE